MLSQIEIMFNQESREKKRIGHGDQHRRHGGVNKPVLGFQLLGGLEDKSTRRASRVIKYTLTPAEMAARGWA